MTIILHIGQPKAGSSTIQAALKSNKNFEFLKICRATYIRNNECKNDVLFFLAQKNSFIPRSFCQNDSLSLEEYKKSAFRYFEKLKENKNKNFISSSEYLFRLSEEEIRTLLKRLGTIDNEIKIFLYIRDPLKYYISKFGQDLKFSTKYKNPSEKIKNTTKQLKIWKKLFEDNLFIFNYDDISNQRGRILGHFSEKVKNLFIPDPSKSVKTNLSIKTDQNESLPLEKLVTIYNYRKKHNIKDNEKNRAMIGAFKSIKTRINSMPINKLNISEEARLSFLLNNEDLYESLKNDYDIRFKSYKKLNRKSKKIENIKNKKTWNLEEIIGEYNKETSRSIYRLLEDEIKKHNYKDRSIFISFKRKIISKFPIFLKDLIKDFLNQ